MLTAKERLRQKLKQRKQSPISSQIKIVAAESGEEKVLSFAQERLWFLSRLMGNAPVYNIPLGIRLAGCLDTEALRLSLQSIIHRHQALRTRFSERDGRVVQTIKQPEELPLEIETVYDNGKLKNIIQQERRYCFDLEQDSLYRIRLLHDCSGINSAKMPGE
ncbi:MAG: condensation domain-containing protein, partial [Exilibacterium sp.]